VYCLSGDVSDQLLYFSPTLPSPSSQCTDNLENLLENPFVAAIYKQTEPYMEEFLTLKPHSDLAEAGFVVSEVGQASRSHRVYVATKPMEV
jgi:hypothetical protein